MDAILAFDQNALLFIQEHWRFDWLNPILVAVTHFAESGIGWIILGIILMFFSKTRRGGLIMLFCLLGAWLVNDFVLKEIVARARPYDVVEGLSILVPKLSSTSFPSGHTNASFACAFALTMVFGKKGAWSYLLAAVIAFSRCYVGVHYPTDVLAGMIVGTVMSFAVYKLILYIERRRGAKILEKRE